jgi:S1-C subfamily serine protease
VTAILLVLSLAQPDADTALSAAVKRAVERAAPSVVRIDRVEAGSSNGAALTGVVIDGDGRIATSSHGMTGVAAVVVTLAGGERVPATRLGDDEVFQLAFLKIDRKTTPIAPTPVESIRVGRYAVAVGRVLADAPTASLGVISALDRVFGKAIQTDAKISPANYGGPLLNLDGRALGVIVPMAPDGVGIAGTDLYDSGIGFAVPMADVLRSAERVKKGVAERGLLGLAWHDKKPLDGPLAVEKLAWKSPAGAAGLRRGDRIKSVDGKPIEFYSQFRRSIGRLYAGDSVTIDAERDGRPVTATVKAVAKLPVYRQPFLGLRLQETGGKLVVQSAEGPAATAGLSAKDVFVELDGPVKTVAAVEARLAVKAAGDAFAVAVERNGKREVKALKSTSWPEAMPTALLAATAKAVAVNVPAPFKHWTVRPDKPPEALVVVLSKTKPDAWKTPCERYGIAVVGSEDRVPGKGWKLLLPLLQKTMGLDARRTVVFGAGPDAESAADALGSVIGAVAAEGGPLSPPPAQPDEARRYLVLQRQGGGSVVEAIKKARDDGVPVTDFEVLDPKPEATADAVARWATGLQRY